MSDIKLTHYRICRTAPDSQNIALLKIPQILKGRAGVASLLVLAFLFRLLFGLCSEFWFEDEKQIYLIGLKFYATGQWPYFGPDVTNSIHIPGALQGLLVGLPFYVLPVPEVPFVLLNIISFAALCFFAWYCSKRLPDMPRWFIWTWLLTAPWTLNLSTHIYNPSYVLAGSIIFFVGVLETFPRTSLKLIPRHWANFMMGFALCWIMQFHMSWVILLPYLLASLYFQYREQGRAVVRSVAWSAAGAALTFSFVLPTYIKYGFAAGSGRTGEVVRFNGANLLTQWNLAEGILGRFLSLASYEMARFLGGNTLSRLEFMKHYWWLIPIILFLGIAGIVQPIAMVILWFKKSHSRSDWQAIKYLTLATVVLLYVGYAFSMKAPLSHTLYVVFPLVMLYSLYCWNDFLARSRRWQTLAALFLICGIIFSAGLAYDNFKSRSLYLNRDLPKAAIEKKDYRMFGLRRGETGSD
ncbi:MAG: hypothetical protein JWM21_1601 [Acidobacteria bacterium]|nr:hypothetical protein [Acidobacteriota bacterium]